MNDQPKRIGRGELTVKADGGYVLRRIKDKFKEEPEKVRTKNLAEGLLKELESLAKRPQKGGKVDLQVAVEFDLDKDGKPEQIRRESPQVMPPTRPPSNVASTAREPSVNATDSFSHGSTTTGFHNPYNFIGGLDRSKLPTQAVGPHGLADGAPVGHHRLNTDCFTGTIDITFTAVTPILIPDAAKRAAHPDEPQHGVFTIRRGSDGKPYIPATSIKGMLSAAYEAITNSRLRVFNGHAGRLGKRMVAKDGLKLVPARIEGGRVKLYTGLSTIGNGGLPNGELYAAWLHSYGRNARTWGPLATHGREVWAYITRWEHGPFRFWNVVELAPRTPAPPTTHPVDNRAAWTKGRPHANPQGHWVPGVVCITRHNMTNKHDERVLFVEPGALPIDAGDASPGSPIERKWRDLITDYQEIHKDEIEKQRLERPTAIDRGVWSRHIGVGASGTLSKSERDLSVGTVCYARVIPSGAGWEATDLFPVNIARELFDFSPEQLLTQDFGNGLNADGHKLRPARSISELSPADRVFGWVHAQADQSRHGVRPPVVAHKGQLRVGRVACDGPLVNGTPSDAIETLPGQHGLPLAILSAPKPSQASFYVAQQNGEPVAEKNRGYGLNQKLRHRKVFPHHRRLPGEAQASYWSATTTGIPQEFLRVPNRDGRTVDNQNRSIKEWIKIGSSITFRIHVTNLSQVELGALLWLLSLDERYPTEKHFLRLGGGKPLGFGSLSARITASDLRTGTAWQHYYSDITPSADLVDEETQQSLRTNAITAYEEATRTAYGKSPQGLAAFQNVAFIEEFLAAARGFDAPIHYPRMDAFPDPQGENFKWFGQMQKAKQKRGLPKLKANMPPLPYGNLIETQ